MQIWFRNILVLVIISISICDFAFAQETPAKKDSTLIYQHIESFSVKRKFTKFMYQLFFKPASPDTKKDAKKKTYKKLIQKPYSTFEGKTIRNINIVTLDPFGFSIGDSIKSQPNFITKTGNKIHVESHNITIRNLLLIRRNQPFDSLLVKESERLVRSMSYVSDVSFIVKSVSVNSDSVDIFIRELDKWSIIPGGSVSDSRINLKIRENNFIGLGHEFQNDLTWNHEKGAVAYTTNYYIPNIRNTYINSNLHFNIDESGNSARSFAIDRPFFSPFAKWAAGVNFAHFRSDSVYTGNLFPDLQKINFNVQDYWAGSAIQLFSGNTEYIRTTNFISAARFLRIRFAEKPIEMYDTAHFYTDENFYMASFGISTRKYVQDKYIFDFGITEDVPVGKVFSLTGGYQHKNNIGRFYLGGRISFGNYYPWGYFGSNFEYGTFINESHTEQAVFKAGMNYFTGLIEVGKWKFRQFIKPEFITGKNMFVTDSLTLKDGYGIDGFNSVGLSGTSRLLLTLQTQSYAPWNFIGFRFGPFFNITLGMLANDVNGFRNSKVYSQIGFGVLIKNLHLVMNTFQLSVAFYPSIPGNGKNIIKLNSFKTTDFGFNDFEIGKPAKVTYQ
ncbi:MAG TPA: hypothetical protein DER09_08505 [Prolixibacteraceae bacterium]|nr:hypothetical protein [Prolixibacteraceae bacterium]